MTEHVCLVAIFIIEFGSDIQTTQTVHEPQRTHYTICHGFAHEWQPQYRHHHHHYLSVPPTVRTTASNEMSARNRVSTFLYAWLDGRGEGGRCWLAWMVANGVKFNGDGEPNVSWSRRHTHTHKLGVAEVWVACVSNWQRNKSHMSSHFYFFFLFSRSWNTKMRMSSLAYIIILFSLFLFFLSFPYTNMAEHCWMNVCVRAVYWMCKLLAIW